MTKRSRGRSPPELANHESTRYTGRRAPDSLDAEVHVIDVSAEPPPKTQRETRDGKRVLVAMGFDLVSVAPPRMSNAYESAEADRALDRDLAAAWGTLLGVLPLGASVIVEYAIDPSQLNEYEIAVRVLVETPALAPADAFHLADVLNRELAGCLAVVSSHFSFRAVEFQERSAAVWDHGLALPQHRTFDVQVGPCSTIGFTGDGGPGQRSVRLSTRSALIRDALSSRTAPLLSRTLRSAGVLRQRCAWRVRMTRSEIDTLNREALEVLATQGPRAPPPEWNDRQSEVVRRLIGSPVVTQLSFGLFGHSDVPRGLAALLMCELMPDLDWISAPAAVPRPSDVVDLSLMLPGGEMLLPLLPSPAVLDAIGFPRHYDNPAVRLPESGVELGSMQCAGFERVVHMPIEDRSRHMYIVGATGTGKSTLLLNLIRQDLNARRGCAVIDPHGDLFEQALLLVPEDRLDDVVIIDPSQASGWVSLNPLDVGERTGPETVSRAINDLLDIFDRLYDMRAAGGPIFEQYFRNVVLLASTATSVPTQDGHDASTGKVVPTLLTVMKVMRDEPFRLRLVEALSKNPVLGESLTRHVIEFMSVAQRATGDRSFANMGSYIASKLTRLTDNRVLRNMLCGGKRTVDFRALMDSNRILLVNLGKGQIGNQDARMLGMLISKYLFHAAMTRADIARKRRTPFYLYLDEFQNFATTEMTEVLSEARKFGLHLVLAHQTLSQISQRDQDGLLQSVLGNVATQLFLRVGVDEAKTLERMIQPRFDASILAQLPDRHAIARLLVDNRPTPPFVMRTHEPLRMAKGSAARAGHARKASHARYGVEEVL